MKWAKNLKEAKKIQYILKQRVKIAPLTKKPEYIAAVDAAFSKDSVIGTACIYKYPELILFEETYAITKILFPYIPGFLSL